MDMIEHRVRERAYYIWEGEGRVVGRADAHWLQAEAEFAAASDAIAAVATVTAAEAAKAPAARAKAPAKAAAPKTAKAVAAKAVAAKAPVKPKKAPRSTEVGIALH